MNLPTQQFFAFKFGVLCCALVWAASTARAPDVAPTPAPDVQAAPIAPVACSGSGGKTMMRTELFFGLTRRDGSVVSAAQFQHFVDQEVTPRFPSGVTLLGGSGQFRDASGATIKENTKVLILLYAHDRDASGAIDNLRAAYTAAFDQESVLRVDGRSCVS